MEYSWSGSVDVTVPDLTRPGRMRQVGLVEVAVGDSVTAEGVSVCMGVDVGGFGVDVETGKLTGEQAVMNASSAMSVPIHFVA